jgi:hypothetical protein
LNLQNFSFSIVVTAKDEDAARETFKIYLKEERNIFNTYDFKVEALK